MTRYFADNDFDRDHGRGDRDRGHEDRYAGDYAARDRRDERHDDRGFVERAGDEVRSWFRDEDAVRRRTMDDIHDYEHARGSSPERHDHAGRDVGRDRAAWGPEAGDMGRRSFVGGERHRDDRPRDERHGNEPYGNERYRDDRDTRYRSDREWNERRASTRFFSDRGANYSNPREEWNDRDRGYENYYRNVDHGQGEYARSNNQPWSGQGIRSGNDLDNGRAPRFLGGNPDYGNNGPDDRVMRASRSDRNVFDRASDEVRSWGRDEDGRRGGSRFDDHERNRYMRENRSREEEWHPNRYQTGAPENREREEWHPNRYQNDREQHPATRRSSDRW